MASTATSTQQGRSNFSQVFVLIIDESSFGLKLVAEICRANGIGSIHSARTTQGGLKILEAGSVNVVICDWGRAPNDGPTFVRRVRAHKDERTRQAPIILAKANPTPADIAAAREAGVTEFLARPFSEAALTTRLQAILGKPRQFVSATDFIGPDRRRRDEGSNDSLQRRDADTAPPVPKA